MNRIAWSRVSRQIMSRSKRTVYTTPLSCTFPSSSLRRFCSTPSGKSPSSDISSSETDSQTVIRQDLNRTVRLGDIISIAFSVKNQEGEVLEQTSAESEEGDSFEVGSEASLKGISDHAVGMKVGEYKQFQLEPEQAFGVHNEDLIYSLSWEQLPESETFEIDDVVQLENPDLGVKHDARVVYVADEGIVCDCNHPYAGQTLDVKMKILSIHRS